MNLTTEYILRINDLDITINQDDEIKIYLHNGEILIGEYNYSDYESLTINREGIDIDIMFEDIKDIERI